MQVSERFVLSFREWRILLWAEDVTSLCFPRKIIAREDTEEEILAALPGMVRRGILRRKEDCLEVAPFYRRAIRSMTKAKALLVIYPCEEAENVLGCYLGETLILVEFSSLRPETICLQCLNDRDELEEHLRAEGYLPDFYPPFSDKEIPSRDVAWQDEAAGYCSEPDVRLVICRYDLPVFSQSVFVMQGTAAYGRLWRFAAGKRTVEQDIRENRDRWLKACMGGEEDDPGGTEGAGLAPVL